MAGMKPQTDISVNDAEWTERTPDMYKVRHMKKPPPRPKKREEKMYSPQELADSKLIDCSERHIRRLCETGELEGVNVGTRSRNWWKIPAAAVDDFMKRRGIKRKR